MGCEAAIASEHYLYITTHIPLGSYINTCAIPSSMKRENVCKVGEGVTSCHADTRQALRVMDVCEARGL
jgi:hypothetical protein